MSRGAGSAANDLKAWVYTDDNEEEDEDNYIFGSDVVIAARKPEDIGAFWRKRR